MRGSGQDVEVGGVLGLGLFFALVISGRDQDLLPSPMRMALVLAWPFVTYAFIRSRSIWLPVGYVVMGAIALRLVELQGYGGSDALDGVWEGIGVLFRGGSPYGHFYEHIQGGGPVPYPPLMFLAHVPGFLVAGKDGVFFNEAAFSLVTMAILVGLAARISWTIGLPALALYAASGNIIYGAADGSVDTGTGALLLVAIVAAAWAWDGGWNDDRVRIAGLAAALPLAMKQTTFFVVLFLALAVWQMAGRRVGLRYTKWAAIFLIAISVPFLALGPLDYIRQMAYAGANHLDVYGWNIWVLAQSFRWPVLDVPMAIAFSLSVTFAAVLVVVVYNRLTSIAVATMFGILITMALFLSARWTSFIYYVMLEPALFALPLLLVWAARDPRPNSAQATPA